jgi:glutamate racemase
VDVVGVIHPGARRAVERSASGRIGVIGTRATIASGAYPAAIRALSPEAVVISKACPLFVPLAEEGWTHGEVPRRVAERYLEPLRGGVVDTLVLGCTHYPLLAATIAEVMGPDVRLVDSAEAVAAEVRERLGGLAAGAGPVEHRFFVTDAPGPFQEVAERFLGHPLESLERGDVFQAPPAGTAMGTDKNKEG